MTTQAVAIILAVGGLLPLLTAVVQSPHWSTRTRTAMAVGVSVLAGIVSYVSEHGLKVDSVADIVTTVVGVVLVSATSYKTLWKPLGTAGAIETATSDAVTGERSGSSVVARRKEDLGE